MPPECNCSGGPRCEYHHCDRFAFGCVEVPVSWKPFKLGLRRFCIPCWLYFCAAWSAR